MLMFEIVSAADALELWKMVNDNVWQSLQQLEKEENERKAAAARSAASKRGKRGQKMPMIKPTSLDLPLPVPRPAAPTATTASQSPKTQPQSKDADQKLAEPVPVAANDEADLPQKSANLVGKPYKVAVPNAASQQDLDIDDRHSANGSATRPRVVPRVAVKHA